MTGRKARYERRTKETQVAVTLDLDGSGSAEVSTGVGMLDHLVEQIAHHGLMDLSVEATGDLDRDAHHTVEDIAIALGRALDQALGERKGIARMGHALVPLDEALAMVALDLSGRSYASIEAEFSGQMLGQLPTQLIFHFLSTFAVEGRLSLHVRLLAGQDDHHRAEAIFKALARSLSDAVQLDPRRKGSVPSTKGALGP